MPQTVLSCKKGIYRKWNTAHWKIHSPNDTTVCFKIKISWYWRMYLYLTLQAQGLWNLFCTLELPLIKILAGMTVQFRIWIFTIFTQLLTMLKWNVIPQNMKCYLSFITAVWVWVSILQSKKHVRLKLSIINVLNLKLYLQWWKHTKYMWTSKNWKKHQRF